jgi:hypothetical protein
MRSLICWIVAWMLLIGLIIAANSSRELAKELEAVSQAPFIFIGAFIALYAFVIIPTVLLIDKNTTKIMKSQYSGEIKTLKASLETEIRQNKHLETKIAELEKQLLNQSSPQPQSLLEPISVIKVSDVPQKPPKLLPTEGSTNKPSQAELKTQALKIANTLYSAIKEAKRQAGGAAVNVELLYKTQLDDFRDTKYKNIVDSILHYYSKDLHDTAVELKTKILAPEGVKLLGVGDYTNPQGLSDLEAIAQDLKDISASPFTQP